MNTTPQPAKIRANKVLASTVWLIPLAAVVVGCWLLINAVQERGPEITLLMDNAEGIVVNTTTIRILNVEVGRVSNIRLRPDRSGVEITAKLSRETADLMRKDTQFWVVKPRIDQNGITGLGTLLSGSYIAFSPGNSEEKTNIFTVSALPPVTAIGQAGLRLHLRGKNRKMVQIGAPVLYENHIVGTVESAHFNPQNQTVEYSIFIYSPNEELLNESSHFWLESGINVNLNGSGLHIDSAPLTAFLSGAVSFDTPLAQSPAIQNNHTFTIYNDRREIESQPGSRTLYYVAFFNQSIRGLEAGAPVEYKGIRIGNVADAPYFQSSDVGRLFADNRIPVRIRIEPDHFDTANHSKEYWQNVFQAALNRGLAATMSSNNLILGSKMIELEESKGPTLKPLPRYGNDPVIATNSSTLDKLPQQVSALLDKFNRLPLEKTVTELNGSLKELQSALHSADRLMKADETQKLSENLNETLGHLDRTLKEAQPLLQLLQQQPNALIFNHKANDPIPKGQTP